MLLFADLGHKQHEEKSLRRKDVERKVSEVKRHLERSFQRRGYRVTAGLLGRIVRWLSEVRIIQPLSFRVAATEILTQSE